MSLRDLVPWRGTEHTSESAAEERLPELRRDFDDLLDRLWRGFGMEPYGLAGEGELVPRFDISEGDDEIEVTVELPGIEEKDVEVSVGQRELTVKGTKRQENRKSDRSYHRVERLYGQFARRVELPAAVDRDHTKARFRNGLLTVTMPKAEKSVTRRIDVQAS